MPHTLPTDDLALLDDPVEQRRFTRAVPGADGQDRVESFWLLSGMYCAACAGIIERALQGVAGVEEVRVSAATQRAFVRWDPSITQASSLVQAVRDAGYDAVPDAAAPARELRRAERRAALWRLFVASFCAMQVMMFATPSYVAAAGELAPDLRQLLNWGSWIVSLPVLLFSAGPFLQGAWRALRLRRISMDVPVALGILVTFVASTGATFSPDGVLGSEVYFDSMTMFVSFLLAGRYLEVSARHRAAEALERTISGMPESALRLGSDGQVETVPLHRLQPGDRVRVPLGAAFPADGVLTVGQTQADESLLSGESTPVPKALGASVVGGSLNLGAPVVMRVERVGADTRFEAIVAMMRDAMTQRPALARWADAWASPFLWAVLILAAGSAAAWSLIDPTRAVWVAVSVLIVTCPCALSLAAPAALVAAAGTLARRGIMVQRLDALESLARMDRLFIDKTGTLTEERPRCVGMDTLREGAARQELARAARALARWSSHPLSQALAEEGAGSEEEAGAASDHPAWLPDLSWREVQEQAGAGVMAQDAWGRTWCLGAPVWLAQQGVPVPQVLPEAEGPVVGFGRVSGGHGDPTDAGEWARFVFDEQLRRDARPAVVALRHAGVRLSLLSGDRPERAARMAQALDIPDHLGGARPEDKLAAVAQAQARGEVVGMVGDGVNDAPVLARADISLAMGQGALVARAQADAVIVSSRLADLVQAHALSRRAMAIVRQNLVWAALYNAACIPLAMLGWLPPWAAGLGMALSSLLVVGNALRLALPASAEPTTA